MGKKNFEIEMLILGLILGLVLGYGLTLCGIKDSNSSYIAKDKIQTVRLVKVDDTTFKNFSCIRTWKVKNVIVQE